MSIKTLFDHINHITTDQSNNYWETLSDGDKKTFSSYMVNRFLSMKMDWVDIINEFQQYILEPKDLYKLYINVLPKGKQWLKYIKNQNKLNYPKWLVELISNYYEIGTTEAEEYINIFYLTKRGKSELLEIIKMHGIDSKLIKKLKL